MTPAEQAMRERDPNYVPDRAIEARITKVEYETSDYGNLTRCTLLFDNGVRVLGEVERHDGDIARTMAYSRAIEKARFAFQWALADNHMWVQAQMADEGMLAVFGHAGGE